MKAASNNPSSDSAAPYARGKRVGRGPCRIRLADSDPRKNVAARSAAKDAAAKSPRGTSMLRRPMLPVTWDVNEPISTKPPEFTKPATNARYPARTALLRGERTGPSRRNTWRSYKILRTGCNGPGLPRQPRSRGPYCRMISMPSIVALSVTVVVLTTIWPAEVAVAVKSRTTALKLAPAAAKMSNFDRTVVPLIATLKTRLPFAVWNSSAKCRRTVYFALPTRLGNVYVTLPSRSLWYTAAGAAFVTPETLIVFVTVRTVPPLENWSAVKGETALLLPQSIR